MDNIIYLISGAVLVYAYHLYKMVKMRKYVRKLKYEQHLTNIAYDLAVSTLDFVLGKTDHQKPSSSNVVPFKRK